MQKVNFEELLTRSRKRAAHSSVRCAPALSINRNGSRSSLRLLPTSCRSQGQSLELDQFAVVDWRSTTMRPTSRCPRLREACGVAADTEAIDVAGLHPAIDVDGPCPRSVPLAGTSRLAVVCERGCISRGPSSQQIVFRSVRGP